MTVTSRWAWLLVALSACGSTAHGVTHEGEARPAKHTEQADQAASTKITGATSATAVTPEKQTGPSVVLMPPGADPASVRIEVARDEATRRQGLMFRQHMDDDAGMLFLFERSQPLTFWMHNTYIPLDMIFIEPSLRVLGVVENAEPMTDSSRSVPGQSQYVLEVNAGWSRRHAVTKGTAVRFEGVPGFDSQETH